MNRLLLQVAAAIVMVAASVSIAASQEITAEVETWRGGSLRLVQPSLDVLHTIVPRTGPAGSAPSAGAGAASTTAPALAAGAGVAIGASRAPEPIQGRDRRNSLTFVRDGVEMYVPFERIASLVVDRHAIASSSLPPYVATAHVRHAARAVLTDGTIIEGSSVNFGSTILRGIGPQGMIELPLEDVKTLKITR